MAWRQLILRLRAADLPAAEALLELAGAQAVAYEDLSDSPILEPAADSAPQWPLVRVSALFPASVDSKALRDALAPLLPADSAPEFRELGDEDWLDAWRSHVRPRQFGRRLWLTTSDEAAHSRGPCQVRLHMGLAFGTGEHATTALCLEWLDGQTLDAGTVLDYGCGTGVLAIAALELGARRAWAVDSDPQALAACRANAELNGCANSIWIGPPDALRELRVDVLAANIVAGPLIEMAETFGRYVNRDGKIVLSGILAAQVDAVVAAYDGDFRDFDYAERDGWCRIAARRR